MEAAGKGNSQEFRILQARYNETNDALEKTKARSKELFGTLSLLPGAVGDFSGKLQGGVDLLKIFSGIKLSDFGAQFKELARDIGGVAGNLFTILQKKPTVVEPTASAGGAAISGEAAATTAESAALSQNSGAQTTNAGARSANTAATIKETQAINKATQAEYEQAVAMLKSEGL